MKKGTLGVFMLVLLAISYFLYDHTGPNKKSTKENKVTTVTGKITDKENGNAISKVTVQLNDSPTKVLTNEKGEYSIPAEKGEQLFISHPKYQRTSVEITEGTQDIQLTPKNSELEDKLKEDFPDMQIVE